MSRISLHEGPVVVLATTYKEYQAALRKYQVLGPHEEWLSPGAEATHHYRVNTEGFRVCIVCMPVPKEVDVISIAATLVHEAVHVWQTHRDDIGEKSQAENLKHTQFKISQKNSLRNF